MPYPAIDLSRIHSFSITHRKNRVMVGNLARPSDPLPPYENPELQEVAQAILAARSSGAAVIWMIGGHVVKRGLAPILIDLMQRGVITHLASNGAASIHDFEFALIGQTSEDVARSLEDGSFGMADETGRMMNEAIQVGVNRGEGMGEALGHWIAERQIFPFREYSLSFSAYRLRVPYTVHVAIGTDIIHQHPKVDFAATGWATGQDFKIFTHSVSQMEGGVFCNFGSAVIGPEVFLKAISISRNLGFKVKYITTANFDLLPLNDYHKPISDDSVEYYYRPRKNIINRPTSLGGRGYHICGEHLLTISNLASLLYRGLKNDG